MGRKKYYCDFCDVLFPDNQEARKKHNSGLAHHRMKEAHYRLFFDAATKLKEELAKGPCRRFQQGMDCRFGDDCRFSHTLPSEMQTLRSMGI